MSSRTVAVCFSFVLIWTSFPRVIYVVVGISTHITYCPSTTQSGHVPMLDVMMDEDRHTLDEVVARIRLNLKDLVLPSDREGYTLSNNRVNLSDAFVSSD